VGWLLDQIQLHGKSKEIVDELVRLSRDYGIMTPYTSFLADERTSGRVVSGPGGRGRLEARGKAMDALGRYGAASGEIAQRDGMTRQKLRMAERAPAPTAPGAKGGSMLGWSGRDSYEADKKEQVANVRQVGQRAAYRRGRVWVVADAADLDLAKDKEKIKIIERYSREYFELVRANSVEENQILATQRADEELVIRLRGQAYRIR